jgi:hypothetical protein
MLRSTTDFPTESWQCLSHLVGNDQNRPGETGKKDVGHGSPLAREKIKDSLAGDIVCIVIVLVVHHQGGVDQQWPR